MHSTLPAPSPCMRHCRWLQSQTTGEHRVTAPRPRHTCRASAEAGNSSSTETASKPPANLVLIGGRGCGKSSISRRIASLDTRWSLLSVDQLIRYEADGATVAEMVAARGWPYFREVEYQALVKATALPEWALIDAGGGAMVDLGPDGVTEQYSERKAQALRRNAVVVFIRRDVRYLQSRLAKKAAASSTGTDAGRPSLSATESFEAVMARRSPWYEKVAHVVIEGCEKDGSPRPKELLTAEVLKAYWSRTDESRHLNKSTIRSVIAKQIEGLSELASALI